MGFFDTIFDYPGASGYVHVALFKNGKPTPNGRRFLRWPEDRDRLEKLESYAKRGDLYFSPALYSRQEATRQAAIGTFVTWADVDRDDAQRPAASLLVESGTPGHIHAYWCAGELLPTATAEAWNYYNAATYNADQSGWDITQLLRVPGTLNYKTDPPLPVRLVHEDNTPVSPPVDLTELRVPHYSRPDILPTVETILDSHELSDVVVQLLQLDAPPDRSDTMYRLACEFSEAGLNADEAFVLLERVDDKWGKYVGRSDRDTRLSQLIAKAYEATLSFSFTDDTQEPDTPSKFDPFEPVGWRSLGLNAPPIDFIIDGLLVDRGFMLIAGDTGIGKTQTAINLCAKLVLGAKDWAGFKITSAKQQRILYVSLEMEQAIVKLTTDKMSAVLTMPQLDLLEDNLRFIATVANYKLDVEPMKLKGAPLVARQRLERAVKNFEGCTGVVIDTIGAATSVSLQEEPKVRSAINWIKDTLRHKYGVWVMILSHPRKEAQGTKRKEIAMDDVYGSRVLGDEMDTAFGLQDVPGSNRQLIELVNLKSRLSAMHGKVLLRRSEHLWIEKSTEVVPAVTQPKANDFTLEDDSASFMTEDPNEW